MKPKLRGVGCEFAGAGRIVCASTQLQTSVRPLPIHKTFVGYSLGSSPLSSSRSPLPKQNRPPLGSFDPLVAGCATGSLRPRRPSLAGGVLGLYFYPRQKEYLKAREEEIPLEPSKIIIFCV